MLHQKTLKRSRWSLLWWFLEKWNTLWVVVRVLLWVFSPQPATQGSPMKGWVKSYWWLFWDIFWIIGPWFLPQCLWSSVWWDLQVFPGQELFQEVCTSCLHKSLLTSNEQSYQNSRWLSPGNLAWLKQCDSGEGISVSHLPWAGGLDAEFTSLLPRVASDSS